MELILRQHAIRRRFTFLKHSENLQFGIAPTMIHASRDPGEVCCWDPGCSHVIKFQKIVCLGRSLAKCYHLIALSSRKLAAQALTRNLDAFRQTQRGGPGGRRQPAQEKEFEFFFRRRSFAWNKEED